MASATEAGRLYSCQRFMGGVLSYLTAALFDGLFPNAAVRTATTKPMDIELLYNRRALFGTNPRHQQAKLLRGGGFAGDNIHDLAFVDDCDAI
jgi:hypothetical protein